MSRKAVVFGSSGQLGAELMQELQRRQYTVRGWSHAEVNIVDTALVEAKLIASEADVVFNAAAYNQVDLAEREPQAAYEVNALAVRNLALACRQMGAQLVHFSTDYVFDGRAGRAYTEEDSTHPLGAYAVSKLAGELYAQGYLEQPLILRTSGVFGPNGVSTARGNFVELMLRLAREGQPIRVVQDVTASPAYAPVLAARAADLVDRGLTGVFHAGGGTPISWFHFAEMIFDVGGLAPPLQAITQSEYRTATCRPPYSALSNAKMEASGVPPFPPLREALESYFARRAIAVKNSG